MFHLCFQLSHFRACSVLCCRRCPSFLSQFSLELLDCGVLFSDGSKVLGDVPLDSIHVPRDLGDDILGSVGIFEGVSRVLDVNRAGRHTDNHHCPAIAAQTELEQSREFTIPVRDVRLPCAMRCGDTKRIDAVSESQKRLVNVGAFLHSVAHVLRRTSSFASR